MTPWKVIKLVLFVSALGWMVANVAGLVMAAFTDGSPGHMAVHAVLALGCGVAAWFLRPRRAHPAALAEADPRLEMLEAEISDLQRQLNETRRSVDFTEQLLTQRPEPRKDQP